MTKPVYKTFGFKVDSLKEVPLKHRYVPCYPGIAPKGSPYEGERVMFKPNPLPCTIIFVHGVNSEGEWYNDAERHLCNGLNDRLGRHGTPVALRSSTEDHKKPSDPYHIKRDDPLGENRPRFDPNLEQDPYVSIQSPVIRFYWGYKAREGDHERPAHPDINDPVGTDRKHRRQYPVPLDKADSWGGGPFQNGTSSLYAMYRKDAGLTMVAQALNPITDRYLTVAPPRTYYVHAAWRLAYLIHTIRKNSSRETINIVSHSQGTMVAMLAMLAMLLLKEQGVRGPEALFVCNSTFNLNSPGSLEAVQFGNDYVISQQARFNTLKAVADVVKQAGESPDTTNDEELADCKLSKPERKPWATREQYGNFYVYANPHDRVMGASVLRSIGWRGLTTAERNKVGADNLKVRVFANNIKVGNGDYDYTLSAESFGITKDDDGNDIGRVRTDFWYPSSEKVVGVYGLYDPPAREEEIVRINAKTVPWIENKALRKELEKPINWPELQGWDGKLKNFDEGKTYLKPDDPDKDGSDARDVAAYKQVWGSNYKVKRMVWDQVYGRQVPEFMTAEEAVQALKKINHNMTDHSTVPMNELIVRGVMAWDLALGLNQSYTDHAYWRYLKTLADWKLSDPYFLENPDGLCPEPGKPPVGVDTTPAYPPSALPFGKY